MSVLVPHSDIPERGFHLAEYAGAFCVIEVVTIEQALRDEIQEVLEDLPDTNVKALLNVLRRLGDDRRIRRWSSAVGSISDADADAMRGAIEEGCETIDRENW